VGSTHQPKGADPRVGGGGGASDKPEIWRQVERRACPSSNCLVDVLLLRLPSGRNSSMIDGGLWRVLKTSSRVFVEIRNFGVWDADVVFDWKKTLEKRA